MAYSTFADIEKDFPNTSFTSTTKVTDSDIDDFITDADAMIDSYLAGRYEVPVTAGASALSLLRLYSRTLVSDKVKGILEIKQASGNNTQNVRSGLTTKDVIKQLEAIRDGAAQLPGAALALKAGGLQSFNVKEGRETRFHMDEEEW